MGKTPLVNNGILEGGGKDCEPSSKAFPKIMCANPFSKLRLAENPKSK